MTGRILCAGFLLVALLLVLATPALTQDEDTGDWDKSPFDSPVGWDDVEDSISRGHVVNGDTKARYTSTYDVQAVLDQFRQAMAIWMER